MLQSATCENIVHFFLFAEDKVITVEKHTSIDETVVSTEGLIFLKFSRQEECISPDPPSHVHFRFSSLSKKVIHFQILKLKFIFIIIVLMEEYQIRFFVYCSQDQINDAVQTVESKLRNATSYDGLTPTLAWLSISKRLPDESYRGVTISVGGLGAAWEINKFEL